MFRKAASDSPAAQAPPPTTSERGAYDIDEHKLKPAELIARFNVEVDLANIAGKPMHASPTLHDRIRNAN